jgi:hypothetical protein
MARIDWLTARELAFFDRRDRLCLVGMTTRLPVPSVPLAINQLMLVARLTDLHMVEEFEVRVEVVRPNGMFSNPLDRRCISIETAGEYVLVTLRGVPIPEAGMYQFHVSLTGQDAVVVWIPVTCVGTPEHYVGVH